MHPVLRFGTAAIVAAGLCAHSNPAQAEDRLSVGVGFGYKIDANRLGETISTDGLDAAAPRFQFFNNFESPNDPVPELGLLDQSVIAAENSLVVLEDLGQISDLKQGGAMVAFDIAINIRYDFLDVLFARIGFNYSFRGIGGETSWKSDQDGDGNFTDEHLQKWDYSAIGIPLYLGVNVPIKNGQYNVYAGVGAAWGSGGFTLELKAPAGWYYSAINGKAPLGNDDAGNLTAGKLGAVNEKASIEGSAIGLGYLVGVDGEIAPDFNIFIEAETQYIAKMSEAVAFSDETSGQIFGSPKLAYPAIPGGQVIRLGLKYTFMTL